ncbi:hypothetical protein GCM10017044_27280 [Kordiimonas sediminis]|uniref:Permease n=1 Tax=Kordiimonas sediminis TaxID=1735581 RepID=A0A919AXJ8_9PROT|nr:hypothetical protein [Kordiimonas sediminis]GHF30444.1 hypothetical protein GCM10017044_27280 [Kordiimonas sediminis]
MSNSETVLGGGVKPSSQLMADVNAGFAFFLDCVVNLFVLSGIMIGAFGFPSEVMFGKIIPGAIVGILFGNLIMVWVAKRSAARTGNTSITSIPMGLDLPTIFGMVFFILGPVYLANLETLGEIAAAEKAWHLGMACALWMAIFKGIFSFFGRAMQQELPQTALIGSMAGIAIVWLGAEALLGVLVLPEVGIVSLIVMAFALISGHRLPFNLPGAVLAILAGTVLYYVLAFAGVGNGYVVTETPDLVPALPTFTLAGFGVLLGESTNYLGIVIPFALLIAASSVNVVAGAKIVGDEYDPALVVRLDSLTTVISAVCGGVVQTTPYFGHPTYKRMGAQTNYALGAAGIITVGGFLGVIAFASLMIPTAVLKPILVVVASDIVRLAFTGSDVRHAPAFLFAVAPGILNYAYSKVTELYSKLEASVTSTLSSDWLANYALLGAMANGYVLVSLVWGAFMVWIIDRRLVRAGVTAFSAAILTLFGVIHSVSPDSGMYLPWNMPDLGGVEILPFRLAAGYVIAGIMLLALHLTGPKDATES